jgi:hypothetical protein
MLTYKDLTRLGKILQGRGSAYSAPREVLHTPQGEMTQPRPCASLPWRPSLRTGRVPERKAPLRAGLEVDRVRHLKSPVSPSPQRCNAAFGSAVFGPRGFALRSKFSDCPVGTVESPKIG